MENSKIEWTHHTFNPWIGCTKVSPGCLHCYAEAQNKRFGREVWGANAPRQITSETYWKQPLKWNLEAIKEGQRKRVFCASMADVFEGREDLVPHRERLFQLIEQTPSLDWLLLTKRPQNIASMIPASGLPWNVWLGTSAEDQARWDERIPALLSVPASVHFVSAEPLIGPITMGNERPDWLIVGGESGGGCRPMPAEWVQSLRDQCDDRTALHFKQWGGFIAKPNGRELDGRTWDELPVPRRTEAHPLAA